MDHFISSEDAMTKRLIVDPPEGWKYGFPKRMPEDIIGSDRKIFCEWLIAQGYPIDNVELALKHSRYWECKE